MTAQTKRRIQKITTSLSPKQAVVGWMVEAHRCPSYDDYTLGFMDVSLNAMPLSLLSRQVSEAITQATKKLKTGESNRVVRQALLDTYFLYHLHAGYNNIAVRPERLLRTMLLSEQLRGLLAGPERTRILWHLDMEAPYPVDNETAAAIEALKRHEVASWSHVGECWIYDWVGQHFRDLGNQEIPFGAYVARDPEARFGRAVPLDEVESLFPDRSAFDRFMAREDFNCGFVVPDAEYGDVYEAAERDLEALVVREQLHGETVTLDTIPPPCFREVPVVEGKWLDRWVVEFAEWGAMLKEQGFEFDESDNHYLAWPEIQKNGEQLSEEDRKVAVGLREQARVRLGEVELHTIDGREYVQCDAYFDWPDRTAPGDGARNDGIVATQFHDWIAAQKDGASLGGISITASGFDALGLYQIERDVERARLERKQMLESLRLCRSRANSEQWSTLASQTYIAHYSLITAGELLSRRYFGGQSVTFAETTQRMQVAMDLAEGLIHLFNQHVAETELDIDQLRCTAKRDAESVVDEQVALAKAEAHRTMGDEAAAMRVLKVYLDGKSG